MSNTREAWLIPHAGPLKGCRIGPFPSWGAAHLFDRETQPALWNDNIGPALWGPTGADFFLHFKETPITPTEARTRLEAKTP